MEHCADSEDVARRSLIEEVLSDLDDLCQHPFAHHVVKAILEHGTQEQKRVVFGYLSVGTLQKIQDRYFSYVVEAALEDGSHVEPRALAEGLLAGSEANVIAMSQSRYGCNILRTMLKPHSAGYQTTLALIRQAEPFLRGNANGQRLLREAGLSA
jgi:hypothetical protein